MIFAVILIVLGAFFGFRRGIIKNAVRLGLWAVFFIAFCLLFPKMIDAVLLFAAELFEVVPQETFASGEIITPENIIEAVLQKTEWLAGEEYLIEPTVSLIRSLLIPIFTVAFFWISWLLSSILYFFVWLIFLRNIEFDKKNYTRFVGMAAGIVIALLAGAITLYPAVQLCRGLEEIDSLDMKAVEFSDSDTTWVLSEVIYDNMPVQQLYQYTGMEQAAATLHCLITNSVVGAGGQSIWDEFPALVSFGISGIKVMQQIQEGEMDDEIWEQQVYELAEDYFALEFIDEEQKLLLLQHLKEKAFETVQSQELNSIAACVEFKSEKQVLQDIVVYGRIYHRLNEEHVLAAFSEGEIPSLTSAFAIELLEEIYRLSTAEKLVPVLLQTAYTMALGEDKINILKTDDFVLNDQTKADIEELLEVMDVMKESLGKTEEMTIMEQMELLIVLSALEDNTLVDREKYEELIASFIISGQNFY